MVRKRILSTVMSLMVAATVLTVVPTANNVKAAQQEMTEGDYTYTKESDGKTTYAVITGYKGNEENLILPDELDGVPVKTIRLKQTDLKIKSITLSKNISPRYLLDTLCDIKTLESVGVVKDNPYYSAEDGVLYNKDKSELVLYPSAKNNETYKMPSTVKEVDSSSGNLRNNQYMKNLITSENLEISPTCSGNSVLESVVLSDSVILIDESDFEECKNLKNVQMGKNIKYIGDFAFYKCSALKQIKLPENLKEIEDFAFAGAGIKELDIPDSVVYIGKTGVEKNVKLNKRSYLKKFKQAGTTNIYYQARATVRSGKKATTYKATRITKIKASKSKVTIKKGKSSKLQTKVYISKKLKKGYLDPEILKYTSSNKKVVKVTKTGKIKGLKKGKATITVKLRTTGKSYKVSVKVK